jgi:hypothetical protein
MSTLAPPPLPYTPRYAPKQQTTAPTPADTCACTGGVALTEERGATLSCKLTLTITDASVTPPVKVPVDITGCEMQFTAKVDATYADDDPSTVQIDWTETNSPMQGITWLVIPAATTATMQAIAYVFQIRMVSSSGVVTPVLKGTLTITEPISARH